MKQFLVFLFFFLFSASTYAQSNDSVNVQLDSIPNLLLADTTTFADTALITTQQRPVFKLKNKLLNTDGVPASMAVEFKKVKSKDLFFYLVAGMVLLLAFFKYFYARYFANLFRVFFNTSLRQSQLTDQLLQAKLPSLFFNLFFIISGGIYVYILLLYFKFITDENKWTLIFWSIALTGAIYLIKFCTLKFTGWITGLAEATDTYIFVVFLINKIIGIFLVPFIIVLSFSDDSIVEIAALVSVMSIGIFLLLRFIRSYSLLQHKLKISRFHFSLYIAGIEILPLLLIYKGLMVYLSKIL